MPGIELGSITVLSLRPHHQFDSWFFPFQTSCRHLFIPFGFWDTPGDAQGLILGMYLEIAPGLGDHRGHR